MTWKRPPVSTGTREIIMLDAYLNSLDAQEKEKTASQARFGAASVVELAKMAGLELGEHVCTNCGDEMAKLGSVYRCDCGMVKKAAATCPGGKIRSKGMGQGKGYGKGKGPGRWLRGRRRFRSQRPA